MNIVEVYVETVKGSGKYELLEGFDDESINMKIIAKDYNDLSKVFTPFSQSFTVPAQGKNGRILNFFLDTDVRKGNTSRLSNAKIYINKELYKTGQVSIVSGKRKFGLFENYVLNFSTGVPNLKELIGDDTISSLPISLPFLWSNANVYQFITNPPIPGIIDNLPDIYVPLISNKRVWTYSDVADTGVVNNNIRWVDSTIPTNGVPKAIDKSELRPAIRLNYIYNAIIQKYNLNVNCPIVNTSAFKGIYVHCTKDTGAQLPFPLTIPYHIVKVVGAPGVFNATVNTVYNKIAVTTSNNSSTNVGEIFITTSNLTYIFEGSDVNAKIKVYDMRAGFENSLLYTSEGLISKDSSDNESVIFRVPIKNGTFGLSTTNPLSLRFEIEFDKLVSFSSYRLSFRETTTANLLVYLGQTHLMNIDNTLLNTIPLENLIPDIKVIDWLTSFFKMFNIIIIESKGSDELLWLTPQDIVRKEKDFTKYVEIDEDNIKVQKLFKVYNFTHKMPKYFSNVNYKKANESSNTNSKEYGQLLFTATERFYDGEYKTDTVFSIVPQTTISDTNVQTQYAFDDSRPETDSVFTNLYQPNYGEFTVFYCNGIKDLQRNVNGTLTNISFAFREGTVNSKIDTYVKVGISDTDNVNTYTTSLGFQAEVNILPEQFVCLKNQFSNYYLDQITLLNNPNFLGYEFTAYLPPQEVKDLDVRDKLVIGEKSYLIQSADVDLTTGKTKLILNNIPIGLINTPPDATTSMWTINKYNSPNLFFTRNYGSDTVVTVQTSTDGINWINNTGSVTSPRNIGVIPTGILIRLQSVSDLSTSNIITV